MAVNHSKILAMADRGHWDEAHESVQPYSDRLSCLIHAYLHRVEGDLSNARYWYGRAGEKMPANTIDEEMTRLRALINDVQ